MIPGAREILPRIFRLEVPERHACKERRFLDRLAGLG
jgi:hypothetical protein